MATNINELRAKHMRGAERPMERDGSTGREEQTTDMVSLSDEERDMRNAGRRLAYEEDTKVDLAGAVKHLTDLLERQDINNQNLMRKLDGMVTQLSEVVDEVHEIQANVHSEEHNAQQAAIMGVGKVQHEAEAATIRSINEATKQSQTSIKKVMESSRHYIESLTQESKKRIERLALITLPDKLFHGLMWVALILVLFILSHVAWQLVM